ncbi:hypothetical protein GWK47_042791 [Chionoecetes opilio]|uniref:Uncharacterized protein n=1 Tax=Chionoecetes opilio TaxID=41210 RepID=A0A8J4YA28_CHIOP|nr:hypothetical protein GWK47_042791 [Chionoecetes opilio]
MMEIIVTELLETCNKYIPKKKRKGGRRTQIPRARKILMRKRTKLNKQMDRTEKEDKKQEIWTQITEIEENIQKSHEQQRKSEESNAITNIKLNPNYFFSYAKKFSKACAPLGPLLTPEGQLEENAENICKLLAEQYQSPFSKPDEAKKVTDPHPLLCLPTPLTKQLLQAWKT